MATAHAQAQKPSAGVTFPVHKVAATREPLPTIPAADAMNLRLIGLQLLPRPKSSRIGERPVVKDSDASKCLEAFGATNSRCLESVQISSPTVPRPITLHALAHSAWQAYSEHRPLVLSPDVLWVTLLQGIAQHVNLNKESLRDRFVSHAGKAVLSITPDLPTSWSERMQLLIEQIRETTPVDLSKLSANFSTTDVVSRIVADVAILEIYIKYYDFEFVYICGIPSITLSGTPADWRRLRSKCDVLLGYDLDWWHSELAPILDQFVMASQGNPQRKFWRGIVHRHKAGRMDCGPRSSKTRDTLSGWLPKLFPYVTDGISNETNAINPMLTGEANEISINRLPSGIAGCPVTVSDAMTGRRDAMHLYEGLIGVEQSEMDHGLKPSLGWCVVNTGFGDVFRELLDDRRHRMLPPMEMKEVRRHADEVERRLASLVDTDVSLEFPEDLLEFYRNCNGGELFVHKGASIGRIIPMQEISVEFFEQRSIRLRIVEGSGICVCYHARKNFGNKFFTWVCVTNCAPERGVRRTPAAVGGRTHPWISYLKSFNSTPEDQNRQFLRCGCGID